MDEQDYDFLLPVRAENFQPLLNLGVSRLVEGGPRWETRPDEYRDHTALGLTHISRYPLLSLTHLSEP